MKLKIIIVSTRPGRVGPSIANWFYEIAKNHKEFETELIDLVDINLPLFDEPNHPRLKQYTKPHTLRWSSIIEDGDAYVFVTPEYNYGFPASLKNALDYLSQEWKYKPVAFVSYGGIAAGTRSIQLIKPVVTALGMMPIFESVNIPFFSEYLDENKVFKGNEKFETSANEMLNKLKVWAKHMGNLRAEMNSEK